MKSTKEPKFLPDVLEAIANLKERHGSSQKQITEHIASALRRGKNSRNVTLQVRRAIDHGLEVGLIKHRSGKFVLGLDKKDYAIFRRFRQLDFVDRGCRSCRRGRRRGRRGSRKRGKRSRRRRHRRHSESPGDDLSEEGSESGQSEFDGTPEPQDRRGRRRGKKGRGRRRRRGGKRRRHSTTPEDDKIESGEKQTKAPQEKGQSEQEQQKPAGNKNKQPSDEDMNQQDQDETCQDPNECICSLQYDDTQSSRAPNFYNYDDSYYN